MWREPFEWLGSPLAQRYPLHLISDQPARRLHSQLDPSPRSRAGKVQGREGVHINPVDAAQRGIADGDVVELFNDRGPCLRPTPDRTALTRAVPGRWYYPAAISVSATAKSTALASRQTISPISSSVTI